MAYAFRFLLLYRARHCRHGCRHAGCAARFGLAVGLLLALLYNYGGKWVARAAGLYSLLMRGVPPVVLLFILYFLLSGRLVNLSPFWAGSLSLGLVSSAYQMEILRGALAAVRVRADDRRARTSTLKPPASHPLRHPAAGALRLAIPPWSNEASIVLKDSSLVSCAGRAGDFAPAPSS